MNYKIQPEVLVAPLSFDVLESIGIGNEVLILSSRSVEISFKLDKLFSRLSLNRKLHIYNHIRPDAPFKDLDIIIQEQKKNNLDYIIAIGGGSVIDAAKTLSISFEGIDYKDVFYKRAAPPVNKIPVLAIPTTAGTGAELSFGAIVYDNYNKIKGGLRGEVIQPNAVLIDARLHNSCPYKLKAEVGFDCLTHAVETYISKKSNSLVKIQSISCIKNIFKFLVPACKNNDIHSMEKIALSSALMGINLAYSSTCLPHRIQYSIGPLTQTSHAQGLIALYKGWLKYLLEIKLSELDQLSNDLSMTSIEFVEKIQTLKKVLDIDYSLTDLGVKLEQVADISKSVSGNVLADPSYLNTETLIKILKYSM